MTTVAPFVKRSSLHSGRKSRLMSLIFASGSPVDSAMIFNTFAYFLLFLLPAAIGFRNVPSPWRPAWIACFGAGFFLYFSLTTAGGLAGAFCLGIFLWEAAVSRWYRPKSFWCWCGIFQAVLFLFLFKYWNFAVGLFGTSGRPWHWPGAFLPLGISFFTFEFIHYAEDRRRDRTEAGTFWEYFAFILFFPTMVAGPIKRYPDFLQTLRAPSQDWARDFERGITRILAGLAKKFAIADLLTAATVHLQMADLTRAQRWVLPVWLLAYGFKIYIDFSAYSDIAIGSARLFGLQVKENFDWPYLRTNIADFWSHWHMSLTRWLTDYIFIPLGGSRVSKFRVLGNVLVTFLISGLWHGAGLNFIVWGLWHGAAIAIYRFWSARPGAENPDRPAWRKLASGVLTFAFVNLGWAWFAMDLPTACFFMRKLFLGQNA